ncbi:GIY-YIG nuclease family protein [Exiguobacterium qingdaonense]|uniref:GIY-YIG nuclease family protein n=1 Tax=Exiguobacterium qingdaonense TaxID=2751251 RepID=UPI001BEB1D02|nr:GIY-YIG nuclease family protein [Exiguobacterium qingdaonense]
MKNQIDVNSSENEQNIAFYVYEFYLTKSNEVFYVGKGTKQRAWRNARNAACEQIKQQYDWDVRIVESNLFEEDALSLEKELILNYRETGGILTNILPGNSKITDTQIISHIKYVLFLIEQKVIAMSLSELSNIFFLNSSTVWNIANTDTYSNIEPLIPDNIEQIVNTYHYNSYNEDRTRAGNIKYVLSLLEKGVIKTTQSKIAEFYGMTGSNVSSIKKGQTHSEVPPLLPENIGEILTLFNPFDLSEEERLKGYIAFILRLRNEGIVEINNTELANLLGTTTYMISEFTRTNEDRRYQFQEVRPTKDIMTELLPYFVIN